MCYFNVCRRKHMMIITQKCENMKIKYCKALHYIWSCYYTKVYSNKLVVYMVNPWETIKTCVDTTFYVIIKPRVEIKGNHKKIELIQKCR